MNNDNNFQNTETIENYTSGVIDYLNLLMDRIPNVRTFLTNNGISSASLFTPQILSLLDGEIGRNPSIYLECLTVLDVLSMYSFEAYGDTNTVFDKTTESIITNRCSIAPNLQLAKETISDFLLSGAEDTSNFLYANKFLVALYLITLVDFMV